MAKYLLQGFYTQEGVKGIATKGGSERKAAVAKAAKSLGGRLETFYFAFGDPDALAIVDLPDGVSAAALSLAVNSSGTIHCRTTVLMTVEEMDEAAKKGVGYTPPGVGATRG
jgi:uncharacterized protein with GYD domain